MGDFMKNISLIAIMLVVAGCVHESAIPLGNDMAQIDVSAAAVYGRAGAKRIALQNAADFTLKMGYDKFVVANNGAWNEGGAVATSYGNSNLNASGGNVSGSSNSGGIFHTTRNPEATMIIKMFHYGDPGADKAVDARALKK